MKGRFCIEQVFARQVVAAAVSQVYTVGDVSVEKFLFTCDSRSGRTKGLYVWLFLRLAAGHLLEFPEFPVR